MKPKADEASFARRESGRVAATPGYFYAIGMTLLDGRTFEPQDGRHKAPLVVIVNETFVARYFWGVSEALSANASAIPAARIGIK